ncbi:MAG: FtsX-like permease family protein [Rhodothermales bacterium]|nr:FtsX-like permease family protein [Rhodothermales bacterium]
MAKLLKLAWRDIWRNRRRSLITMSAIVFALLIITMAHSIQNGTYDAMEEVAVRVFMGDVQIHRTGYYDERTFSYSIETDERNWAAFLDSLDWVDAWSMRLSGFGLMSSDSSSVGGMIVGIDPEREYDVSTFPARPVAGERLAADDDQRVLLGRTLARNLDVTVGDTVVVLTQGYRNAMGADLYVVKGLLRTGNPDVDRSMMVMNLDDAQFLFSMENRFTELVLRTDDFRRAPSFADRAGAALDDGAFEVMPWTELMPEIQQARALDDVGNYIFYMFLLLMVGFEIFNTTMMSVMERVREFGVMMSIGMKPRTATALVAVEMVIKVALAACLGLLLAAALITYFRANPIPLSQELRDMYETFGFTVEGFSFSASRRIFVQPLMWVGSIALAALAYPMLRIHRFTPIEALRRFK